MKQWGRLNIEKENQFHESVEFMRSEDLNQKLHRLKEENKFYFWCKLRYSGDSSIFMQLNKQNNKNCKTKMNFFQTNQKGGATILKMFLNIQKKLPNQKEVVHARF